MNFINYDFPEWISEESRELVRDLWKNSATGSMSSVKQSLKILSHLFDYIDQKFYDCHSEWILIAVLISLIYGQRAITSFLFLTQIGFSDTSLEEVVKYDIISEIPLWKNAPTDLVIPCSPLTFRQVIEWFGNWKLFFHIRTTATAKVPTLFDFETGLPEHFDKVSSSAFASASKLGILPPHENLLKFQRAMTNGRTEFMWEQIVPVQTLGDRVKLNDQLKTKISILHQIARGLFSLHCVNCGHGCVCFESVWITGDSPISVKLVTKEYGQLKHVDKQKFLSSFKEFYPNGNQFRTMQSDVKAFSLLCMEMLSGVSYDSPFYTHLISIADENCNSDTELPHELPTLLRFLSILELILNQVRDSGLPY